MKVKLKNTWFASTPRRTLNSVHSTVGRRYKPGVHDMPEEYRDILPSTAEVLEDEVVQAPEVVETKPDLKDFDIDRVNADAFNKIVADVQEPKQTRKRVLTPGKHKA